jgi:hypothetical protein
MGLDAKTYWFTDRQSQCDFDFDFDNNTHNYKICIVRPTIPMKNSKHREFILHVTEAWNVLTQTDYSYRCKQVEALFTELQIA